MSSEQKNNPVSFYDPHKITEKDAVSISEEALAHFRKEIKKKGHAIGVRLSLEKSGCTGYRYVIDLVDKSEPGDHVFTISDDFSIFVSKDCFLKVRGSRIEYTRKGLNKIIEIKNPNETARCGCGESFTTE
ncbi:MAG: Fe-S cluster assembly scaffold protein [Gammaproteobacteria bacterium]|nr:Fe-S cluster assembly scaffold protein [Gammaproteobacteria bacterium]